MKEVEGDRQFEVSDLLPDEDENTWYALGNIQVVQAIVQMRIYDVLMTLIQLQDPDACAKLHDIHAAGKIMGPFPSFVPEEDE